MIETADEISKLIKVIQEKGTNGEITYGKLFDLTANILEALNGTLRSAKRQKLITFEAELLMMPRDKDAIVKLL